MKSADTIFEEIAVQLKPYKKGISKADVLAYLRRDASRLPGIVAETRKRNDNRSMRTHAKKLTKALVVVEKLVASAPGGMGEMLRGEPPFQAESGKLFPTAEWQKMREVCGSAANGGYGSHPNEDTLGGFCVNFASVTMRRYSTARISSSTPKSKLRVITGLLYQFVSRCKVPPDLERACDAEVRFLNEMKRHEKVGTVPDWTTWK
jgi:hypothetical protein